jgi:hypothetical protein
VSDMWQNSDITANIFEQKCNSLLKRLHQDLEEDNNAKQNVFLLHCIENV